MAISPLARILSRYRDELEPGPQGGQLMAEELDAGGLPGRLVSSQERPEPGTPGLPHGVEVLLGRGSARGRSGFGGRAPNLDTPYRRIARSTAGGVLEGHDYGEGNVKWFKRKNPNALQAAARLAYAKQGVGLEDPDAVQQQIGGLSPEEQKRVRYLLGR